MISWFTENSFFPVVTGGILALIFFLFFVMSRDKTVLFISLGIAFLVGVVFVTEQLIVTDREQIEAVVVQLANDVRHNNVANVVARIDASRQETISRAKAEMPKYSFDDCRLTGVSKFEDAANLPGAKKITFTVLYRVSLGNGQQKIPGQRRVVLTFKRDDQGSWKIIDYHHSDPRENVRL